MSRSRGPVVLAVAVLVVVGLAGCHHSSGSSAGRLAVQGHAQVSRPGEDGRDVTGSRDLRAGDRVQVRQGTASIRLSGGRTLELRQGSDLELSAAAKGAPTKFVLMAGDLLVTSGDVPFPVSATGGDVSVRGAARLSRGVVLLVATYQGSAVLSAGGSSITIPALRQAALPATGAFPARVSPLEPSASDSWDQRFLSGAIELGNQLAARSQGFSAQQAGSDARSAAYFKALFPDLAAQPAFDASLLSPSRPPGETLVGAAIVLQGAHGSFTDRWAAVFGFHDQGAGWGLVALDQGVSPAPLLQSIEDAIARSPATFAPGAPGATSGGSSSLPPSTGTNAPATTSPTRPPTTTAPNRGAPARPTTTTTVPPTTTTTTPRGVLNTGSPLIDDTVNSLVDTLTGLLRSLGQ